MKQKIFILMISLMAVCQWRAIAQADVTVSGGNGNSSGGTVSYSVGQVAYKQYAETDGSVSEGVQQTYEVADLSLENNSTIFDCAVYPNPTFSGVRFILQDSSYPEMHADLFDATGKAVLVLPMLYEQQDIQLGHLPAGTYVLRVYSAKKTVRSFKIIKY
jgi:hypothetical protein